MADWHDRREIFGRSSSSYEQSDWDCKFCGEKNFGSKGRRDCVACKSRKGDWKCLTCGEKIFASKTECRKCQGHGQAAPRPGDWTCSQVGCMEMNFGSRIVCRKCGQGKSMPVQNAIPIVPIVEPISMGNPCVICLDKVQTHLIAKCGHLCFCNVCGFALTKCPMCRITYEPGTDLIKVFAA